MMLVFTPTFGCSKSSLDSIQYKGSVLGGIQSLISERRHRPKTRDCEHWASLTLQGTSAILNRVYTAFSDPDDKFWQNVDDFMCNE